MNPLINRIAAISLLLFFFGLYALDIYAFIYNVKIKEIYTYVLNIFYLLVIITYTILMIYDYKLKIIDVFLFPVFLTLMGMVIQALVVILGGLNGPVFIFYIINLLLMVVLMLITHCIDCIKSKDRITETA